MNYNKEMIDYFDNIMDRYGYLDKFVNEIKYHNPDNVDDYIYKNYGFKILDILDDKIIDFTLSINTLNDALYVINKYGTTSDDIVEMCEKHNYTDTRTYTLLNLAASYLYEEYYEMRNDLFEKYLDILNKKIVK